MHPRIECIPRGLLTSLFSSLLLTGCLCPSDYRIDEGKLHMFESHVGKVLLLSFCSLLSPRLGSSTKSILLLYSSQVCELLDTPREINALSLRRGRDLAVATTHRALSRPQANFRPARSGPPQFFTHQFCPLNFEVEPPDGGCAASA